MSVPYGAPQQQPGPAQQQPAAVGVNLNLILPLVAAGLGLIAYLLAFADDVSSGSVEYLLAAAALAGLTVLPKAPKLLPAAAVLSVVPTLLFLQAIIKSSGGVKGMSVVLLIIALLESAAIVLALLLDAGIVKFEPKPANPYGGQPGGWSPQSGAFPQQGQPQPGQYGPPSGQFGAPVQPQQPGGAPQPTSYMPQPGQFNQPGQQQPGQQQPGQQQPGTPPGGFGGQQQG
ncbi:DUF5336 domain-containing protein [Actinosynnema sp. NPDC047251]|uniref:Putative membrane protein n=1 Tax=Saccharothrix espanaensis (strain ATCC 51144 / DSM 44229 / JCM 9112 / NBRC 15066 / NRRL 15764) TaxID=1179773 RepID=K0K9N0_SACES|nr:DUF5336 domain-containing protein [Saccharothrix espanaensis]CCH35041.1 putative membrane protein [Saccharothrix espanaensis DSM 44229]